MYFCKIFRYRIIKNVATLPKIQIKCGDTISRTFCLASSNTNFYETTWCKRKYAYQKCVIHKYLSSESISKSEAQINNDDFDNVTNLFPEARIKLYELSNRLSDKLYDIYYKQNKSSNVKSGIAGDWTCTYILYWPEKKSFESTSTTKKQAAEGAARKALLWLHGLQRITRKGDPLYEKEILERVQKEHDLPYQLSVDSELMKEITDILVEFEQNIKFNHEETHRQVQERMKHRLAGNNLNITYEDIDEDSNYGDEVVSLNAIELIQPNIHPTYGRPFQKLSVKKLTERDLELERKLEEFKMNRGRLPIDEFASHLESCESRVCIIGGGAGCGKSTRAPVYQALARLKSSANVIVSEPRRVAAIALAERVAEEFGEEVGETIGYQVRLETKMPSQVAGNILYCTSGILLRKLQANPGLLGCSHVFLDEAHERDINTDLILMLLRRSLDLNPELRVVIMSATMDLDVFTRYFKDSAVIEIPGRTFEVANRYLVDIEDEFGIELGNTTKFGETNDCRPYVNCTELAEVIVSIDKSLSDGAILVFLPGWFEIKSVKNILQETYGSSATHVILPVHSKLSSADQRKVFHNFPAGTRKIILSTNISECSLTIPDVACVVDTGLHKERNLSVKTGGSSLATVWVSKASAKQRAGRAGRVKEGICYKMYTRAQEERFPEFDTPEIKRVSLDKTVLDCKILAPNERAVELLSQLPEPPSRAAVTAAVNELQEIGALTKQAEQITPLGAALASLTMQVRSGLSVLHACMLGCSDDAVTCAIMSENSARIFNEATDRSDEIRMIKSKYHQDSDHLCLLQMQRYYNTLRDNTPEHIDRFCQKFDLRRESLQNIKDLTDLHMSQLRTLGLLETANPEEFHGGDRITLLSLMYGHDSFAAPKTHVKTSGKLRTVTEYFVGNGARVHIKPESVNYKKSTKDIIFFTRGLHSTERRALVLDCTSTGFSILKVLLTTNSDIVLEPTPSACNSDMVLVKIPKHKMDIEMKEGDARNLMKFKEVLRSTFANYVEERSENSNTAESKTTNDVFRYNIVQLLVKLLA